jgi:hypothetical protein
MANGKVVRYFTKAVAAAKAAAAEAKPRDEDGGG